MKYISSRIFITTLAIISAMSACNNSSTESTTEETTMETPVAPDTVPMAPPLLENVKDSTTDTVLIKTSLGDITIELYNETPRHRDNFLKLVKEGYYNDIIFHRVLKGFMIQTGDPDSRAAAPGAQYGGGGPGYLIPAEINPNLKHKRGALAAARTNNPEKASSGSQFYICHEKAEMLDGEYTVFGQTIDGLDVIDKIATTPINIQGQDGSGRPVKDVKIISTSIVHNKVVKGTKKDSKSKKDK